MHADTTNCNHGLCAYKIDQLIDHNTNSFLYAVRVHLEKNNREFIDIFSESTPSS